MSVRPFPPIPRRGARRASPQRGGVLLALVLALAGSGALWLASRVPPPSPEVDRTRLRLLDARRALLAHSSAYPESYGPSGAGPGHLPCPDTDTPLSASTIAPRPSGSYPFRGDGPNPPCGGAAIAVGRLPRHVSLPSRRELFHREGAQRFVYAVSADAVNNPPGRIVAMLGEEGAGEASSATAAGDGAAPIRSDPHDPVVVLIVDTGGVPLPSLGRHAAETASGDPRDLLAAIRDDVVRGAGERAGMTIEHVTLRRGELLEAARLRVAAWLVATLRRAAGGASCESYGGRALLALLAESPPGLPPVGVDADTNADAGEGDEVSGTSGGEDDACDPETAPRPDTLERTPVERHWFVRDGWYRLVTLRVEASCRKRRVACRAERVRDAHASLAFRLVAVEPMSPGEGPADPRGER